MALVLSDVPFSYGQERFPTRDPSIPLTAVEVKGQFFDFVGKVQITQTYQNRYSGAIEAKYFFNLDDERSSIISMRMMIGERVLKSRIVEKSEGRETYERAIAEKKTTCLLEKASNGIYTMNVGNILPNQEVRIQFEYLTRLDCTDEGQMKFILPTNISPKSGDGKKTIKDMIADQATLSQLTYSPSSPFSFELQLDWRSQAAIEEVKSFTNEILVIPMSMAEEEGQTAAIQAVRITSKTAPANGDFNVLVKTAVQPTLYVHQKGEWTYLMLNHRVPDEYHDVEGGDYTIIVDRSGSMGSPFDGWSGNSSGKRKTKMDCAREATQLFVQSLPAHSRFNVVSFGSNYQSIFPSSTEYTEATKRTALQEISRFDSNLGGTELLQCLSDVLSGTENGKAAAPKIDLSKRVWTPFSSFDSAAPSSGSKKEKRGEKIIILMTDGDVGNVDAVTSLIKQHNDCARVFTIGIGKDVNRHLVERIAKASNACCEILVDNPDIDTVVAKMLDAASKSFYKNMSLSMTGVSYSDSTVTVDKAIYPNQFTTVYHKLLSKDFVMCSSIQVSCQNGITGAMATWHFPVNHPEDNSQETEFIAQLYAADRISCLEESNASNSNVTEIIKLSLEYDIMNSRTSFVVVDEETKQDVASSSPLSIAIPQVHVRGAVGSSRDQNDMVHSLALAVDRLQLSACDISAEIQQQNCMLDSLARQCDQIDGAPKRKSRLSFSSLLPSFSLFGSGSSAPPPPPPSALQSTPMLTSSISASNTNELKESQHAADSLRVSSTGEDKMKILIQNKKVDGSFAYSISSLSFLHWDQTLIKKFALDQGVTEEIA